MAEPIEWLRKNSAHRNFMLAMVAAFVLGILYPVAVMIAVPAPSAWEYIKNSPNYSIYYLAFFPVAAGTLAAMLTHAHLAHRLPRHWKWAWAPFLLLVFFVVYPDALDKGVPISPVQLRFDSARQRNDVLNVDRTLREGYWRAPSARENASLRSRYVAGVAEVLNINEDRVRGFSSLTDFLGRASFAAFVDTGLTALAGFVVLLFVLFLLYLVFMRRRVSFSEKLKDNAVLVYALLVAWFPFRFYAIWYQNFYSLDDPLADGIIAAIVLGLVAGLLLIVLLKRGRMATLLSTVMTLAGALVGAIAKWKPEWMEPVGLAMNHMSVSTFGTVEAVLIAALVAIVWPYLAPAGASENPPPGG